MARHVLLARRSAQSARPIETGGPDLRDKFYAARDTLRTQIWPMPTVGIVVAIVVGITLPLLDARVDADLPAWLSELLFAGDADAARTVLDAVAGSLITVTALTFSLTLVTLQLASGQFSPRLLRTFAADRFVHTTLAIFLATFVYALTVLRSVRTAHPGQDMFVPRMSVTLGFILAIASSLALVLFLAYLVKQIRVETMLRIVHAEASDTVDRVANQQDAARHIALAPSTPATASPLSATRSGFVTRVDSLALFSAAVDADATIVIDASPGDAIVAGIPIGWVWSSRMQGLDVEVLEQLNERVGRALFVGYERTAAQDIGFGLRQLTDVAVRALSPGVNDPTTAVHALGHSTALLCEVASKNLGTRVISDESGVVRVVMHRPDLSNLLDLAISQPRRYGASDPDVLAQIYILLRRLGWVCPPRDRQAIDDQRHRLDKTVAAQDFDDTERAKLADLSILTGASTRGEWPPLTT